MKDKNTSCLWRETATKPSKADWSFNKSKRGKRMQSTRKKTVKAKAKVVQKPKQSKVIASAISLESLGLSFNPTSIRTATITG